MCLAVRKINLFFKLKQDFLQTRRNILPIEIMNDSSDDTNIKVIQLSKSYLCFTSFSFINNLSGTNDFPHGIFATPVGAAVFAIIAPALNCGLFPLLLSSWKYFATFSIICCSSTPIDFPLFRLEHPGSSEMMSAIFQSTQKASLLGLGPHFIIDDINYQINSSVYVANRGHYYARLIKIHIHLIAFDRIVYREIQLIVLTLMTSSKAGAPELRMVTRDCYWNDKAPF